jgi:hypothetical protein
MIGHKISAVVVGTLQGMARVRSGQARPGPWFLAGVSAEAPGSSVTSCVRRAGAFPSVLVAQRAQSRLMLEGRIRALSGPSPDLSPAVSLAPLLRCTRPEMSYLSSRLHGHGAVTSYGRGGAGRDR